MAMSQAPSPTPGPVLVNKIPQVAKRLNVSVRTVYYLIESGRLKKVKIGRKTSGIRESDLLDFVRNLDIEQP